MEDESGAMIPSRAVERRKHQAVSTASAGLSAITCQGSASAIPDVELSSCRVTAPAESPPVAERLPPGVLAEYHCPERLPARLCQRRRLSSVRRCRPPAYVQD